MPHGASEVLNSEHDDHDNRDGGDDGDVERRQGQGHWRAQKETAPEGTSAAKSFGDARSRCLRHDQARHHAASSPRGSCRSCQRIVMSCQHGRRSATGA